MISSVAYEDDLNLKATELKLGLPGTDESGYRNNKRPWPVDDSGSQCTSDNKHRETALVTKAQVVGWPPIRSYRKNSFHARVKTSELAAAENGIYVKVSVDGAPYLRKIDLKVYKGYQDLLKCLENMFKLSIGEYSDMEGYMGSEYAPAYEDKDGDWMLVGDVPWDMFTSSCKRLRIMKGSETRGSSCGI